MAKRILIADDSVTIQKAFAMTFAGANDVTVASARSADEGLALAQKMVPDLIIADGVMPGRTGYDLCAQVRSDPALRAVPVFILASLQQPYDEARGQNAGADGHLTKPWETTAMNQRVRELLGEGAGAARAPSLGVPAAPAARPAAAPAAPDDDYGEISIDAGRDSSQVAPRPRLPTPPPPPPARTSSPSMPAVTTAPPPGMPAHPPPGSSPGMRPSLIPGLRAGSMPPARPGTTAPGRPVTGPAHSLGAPPRPAAAPVGRTLVGLPAANAPIPGLMRGPAPPAPIAPPPSAVPTFPSAPFPSAPPAAPSRSPTGSLHPLGVRAPTPVPGSLSLPPAPYAPPAPAPYAPPPAPAPFAPAPFAPPPAPAPFAPPAAAAISASVDQKLAAFASKGPEYEAIAKLSREIIEQVVWEIVPELAEAIIREHLEKHGRLQ